MDSIDPAALLLHPHQQQQTTATSVHHHQVYATQSPSPTPSSSSLAVQLQQQSQQSQHQQDSTTVASTSIQDPNLPPKPDRTKHDVVKARYRVLQSKWQDLSADRTKLAADLEAAEQKRDKLQAEADMLIEQMHELAPDISLAPDYVDLSSDEGGDDHYHHHHNTMNDMGYHHHRHGSSGGPLSSSSASYLDGRGQQQYYNNHNNHHHRRMSNSDNNVPSSSINYFSGQLFGPNSGLDFGSDMDGSSSTPSGSAHSSKRGSNAGQGGFNSEGASNGHSKNHERQVMLSPEQAREEEARIEQEQKARERTKSYNPDNVKIRIGVMPSTFVHPLVHNYSNRSSKSRSPSTPSDNTHLPNVTSEDGANLQSSTGERMAKRPRTTSKEKSPVKEQNTIKEEEQPNPP